jgi:hypothetical protein
LEQSVISDCGKISDMGQLVEISAKKFLEFLEFLEFLDNAE